MGEEPNPPASPPAAEAVEPPTPPEVPPPEDWATRFKYLFADFENFRKRAERDRESGRLSARAEVLRSILPLYEASERARAAVAHLPATDPVRKGMDVLGASWSAFLDSERIVPLARPGARFQSQWHEAVAEAPASAGSPEGTVVEVVQQGYRIGTALLRPAKVVVARAPPAVAESAASEPAEADGPGERSVD